VVADERGETKTLAPTQRLFVRGYAVTSYSSQGKTVDTVIVGDAGVRAATNAQQWYVGISRGRNERVVVLTPNKKSLRLHIQRNSNRELAVDVVAAGAAQIMRVPGRRHRAAEVIDLSHVHRVIEHQRERQGELRGMRI
jgi:hypothetical protein